MQFRCVIHFSCIHKYIPVRRFILLDVGTQTMSSCKADSVIIKDPVSGSVQCHDCIKCPAGEGLSVKCGDFIDSQTPLVCQPSVLGETYSSAYEAGACKDCDNCGPYRETTKACQLTSKAVCGKCKVGAYEEPLLSMCKPCSTCCNDGKDIVISQCQVPGIPANEQCSFARSGKCSKIATSASVSIMAPTIESNHSTVESTIPLTGTSPVLNSVPSEPKPALPYDASPSQTKFIAGSVFGGVFVIFILPLAFFIRYAVVKRRKTRELRNDLSLDKTAHRERPEKVQDDRHQANAGDRNDVDHPKSAEDLLEETTVPVQETMLPGHNDTGKSRLKRLSTA